MYALKNSIHKVYKDAAEAVLPVRSQSKFREEGVSVSSTAAVPMFTKPICSYTAGHIPHAV